jgi:hypothetical protein
MVTQEDRVVVEEDRGVAGNERLTAVVGAVLIVMLAVEGITILSLHSLFPVHAFIGIALIPVVLLKLGSTGYRMVNYYLGTPAYKRRGPPPLMQRLLGPVLAVATVVVIGSGVSLLVAGRNGTLRSIHSASFVVFGIAVAIHVLSHLSKMPRLLRADTSRRTRAPGASRRWLLTGLSLLTGAVIATAVIASDANARNLPHRHHDRRDAQAP